MGSRIFPPLSKASILILKFNDRATQAALYSFKQVKIVGPVCIGYIVSTQHLLSDFLSRIKIYMNAIGCSIQLLAGRVMVRTNF